MKTVVIFSTIDAYELSQIADALRVAHFSKGDYIIRQHDQGDNFYIIVEGEAFAAKIFEEGLFLCLFRRKGRECDGLHKGRIFWRISFNKK